MGSTTVLVLFSILLLLQPQPSSPSSIGLNLVDTLRRKLLQVAKTYTTKTPDDTHLKLCETDLCDSRRPDGPLGQGLCDRWARGEKGKCPDEQIFHVQGDPGTNDKAEMFFNLRSPWDVKCEKGKCVPAIGSVYNVYVAEGCIPERDYISEMQDTSDRVSKQVKIYLRRKAEFYITVQRKPGVNLSPDSNCSFGMTVGSIEAKSDTAKCWDFRRIKRGEAAAARIPNCREVMPQLNSYQQPDTSAQATFVVALIGLGILVLALVVLGGVLARRWSRRKAQKAKDLELDFGGVQPGQTGAPTSLVLAAMMQPETTGVVALAVEPAEPRSVDEPRRKQRAAGGRTKEDRQRLERRMMQIEDGVDEEVDDGELGANAGILEGLGSSVSMQFKQGRGGSKLVMGGGKVTGSRATDRPGSGSSGSGSEAGRASPADELYRSRLTARQVPGSPGGSRVPTPPEESKGARGQAPRRKPGVTGAVGGEDIEFSIKHRPGTNSSSGSAADWEDSTGIKIDDILQQARSAAAIAAANGRASAANGKGTPDRSRAWKPGDRSPASSDKAGSSSSGSGPHDLGAQRAKQSEPVPPELPPPPKAPSAVPARPPVMAPLMAARLGIKPQQAVGGRTMAPLGSNGPTSPTGPSKMEPSPGQARTVMLQSVLPQQRSVAALPMAGQAGVPMPPPRGNGSVPSSRNIGGQAFGLNGNGRSSASPAAAEAGWGTGNTGPPAPGAGPLAPGAAAGAWRTPTGTPAQAASRPLVGQAVNGNARPPLGGAGPRGGMGSNGRDGRGMVRIGGGRGAPEEHVLEEEDR